MFQVIVADLGMLTAGWVNGEGAWSLVVLHYVGTLVVYHNVITFIQSICVIEWSLLWSLPIVLSHLDLQWMSWRELFVRSFFTFTFSASSSRASTALTMSVSFIIGPRTRYSLCSYPLTTHLNDKLSSILLLKVHWATKLSRWEWVDAVVFGAMVKVRHARTLVMGFVQVRMRLGIRFADWVFRWLHSFAQCQATLLIYIAYLWHVDWIFQSGLINFRIDLCPPALQQLTVSFSVCFVLLGLAILLRFDAHNYLSFTSLHLSH